MNAQGFDGIEVFVRVARAGSFSAAARELDQTPSAVSKQIGRLEDRLGARLFDRTTRRVRLTEVGTAFFDRCARIVAEMDEAEQAVSQLHGAPRGLLKLNVPVAFGRLHVARSLPEYQSRHPEVRIDLTLNDRFVDLVEEGIDIAVRIGELTDSSLMARRLAPNRRIICGSPDYLARAGMPEGPEDLARHNCVVYTYRASRNDWHLVPAGETGRGGEQVVQVAGNLESNNAEALRTAVLAGAGLALLPLWLVGQDLRTGQLVQALPDYQAPDSAIYAVYPPGRHLSAKVRSFIDFLVERFGGKDAWWRDADA